MLREIEFSSRIVGGILERTDVSSLVDEPLLPRRHGLDVLTMVRTAGEKLERRTVTTCRQWADAIIDGFDAATTYDIKEEAFFKRAYSLIRALSIATVAEMSFVDESDSGLDRLELLPVTLLPFLSGDQERELEGLQQQGTSIADLHREGRVRIEHAAPNDLRLEFDHMGKMFWVVLRADLNSDGVEDMLVSTYQWATEGTLGFGDVIVLTKQAVDAKFRIVETVDLLPVRRNRMP